MQQTSKSSYVTITILLSLILLWRQLGHAVYTNLGSILFVRLQTGQHLTLSEQVMSYYQRARDILPTPDSNFRLLHASYVTSNPFLGDHDLDMGRLLEMARGNIHRQDWASVHFWSEAAVQVEEQSDAYCYLGRAAIAEADLTRAIDYDLLAWKLDRFLYQDSRFQCAYDLTRAYYELQDWTNGDAWLERYKQLGQNRPPTEQIYQALEEFGRLNLACGRVEAVRDLLGYAIETMPDNLWVYVESMDVYLDQEFYQEAMLVCRMVPVEMRRAIPIITRCGSAFYGLQDWEQAAAMYEEFVVRQPDDPWGHYWLADIYAHLGQVDKAAFYADQAQRLAPRDLCISLGMGELYERIGRPSAAIEVYRSALQVHPEDARLQEAIQRLEPIDR